MSTRFAIPIYTLHIWLKHQIAQSIFRKCCKINLSLFDFLNKVTIGIFQHVQCAGIFISVERCILDKNLVIRLIDHAKKGNMKEFRVAQQSYKIKNKMIGNSNILFTEELKKKKTNRVQVIETLKNKDTICLYFIQTF